MIQDDIRIGDLGDYKSSSEEERGSLSSTMIITQRDQDYTCIFEDWSHLLSLIFIFLRIIAVDTNWIYPNNHRGSLFGLSVARSLVFK